MKKIFMALLANLSLAAAATPSAPVLLQIPQDVMGSVTYFPTGDVQKMANDPVHNVTYFLTAEGIVRYSPITETYTMGKDLGFDLNLPFINIQDITTDDQGDLYLLTPYGLYYSNDAIHFKYFKAGCTERKECTNANIIASGQHVLINPSTQDFAYTIDLSDTDPEDSDLGFNGGLLGGTTYDGDLYLVQKHTIMNWSPDESNPSNSSVYWNIDSPFFEFTGAISFTPHLDYITTAYNPRKGISMFCFATQGGKLNCDTTSADMPFTQMLTLPGKMYAFSDDQTVLFTNTGGSHWTTTTPDLNLQNLSILGVGPDKKIWVAGSTKDIATLTLQQAVEPQPLKDFHLLALKAHIPNGINDGLLSGDNQTLLVSAGYNDDLWLSTDQGATFTKIASDANPAFMLGDANDSFLIDGDNNIFKVNGTQPLQLAARASSVFPDVDINAAAMGNNTLYVATDNSILAAATNTLPLQFKKIVSQPNVDNMAIVDGTLYFNEGNTL